MMRLVGTGLAGLALSPAGPEAVEIAQKTPKAQTHTVAIEASSFQSDFLAVNAGDTIVWTNRDFFPHTVTAANRSFDSKDIPPGKSWKYTVRTKGTFEYKCVYHSTMTGVLKVE
jgi:plastocyanin